MAAVHCVMQQPQQRSPEVGADKSYCCGGAGFTEMALTVDSLPMMYKQVAVLVLQAHGGSISGCCHAAQHAQC